MFAEDGVNLDEALGLIEKALELDPGNGAYLDSLGWVYFKKGMLKESLEELEKAIKLEQNDPTVREHLETVRKKLRHE
jgi:tetratricopeptide (TPR) repeat protein